MRWGSLRGPRSRVERLARACGTQDEPRLVIHWMNRYDACPGCGYDLDAHAFRQAVADAEKHEGPNPPRKEIAFYWWPKDLTTCPRCGIMLTWP